MTTLGLLQYIAPSVQLLLGIWVFHEAFDHHKLLGFIAIWAALLVYSMEGMWISFAAKNREYEPVCIKSQRICWGF
jgi:chloramphenicol-sensitive protein RarD